MFSVREQVSEQNDFHPKFRARLYYRGVYSIVRNANLYLHCTKCAFSLRQ